MPNENVIEMVLRVCVCVELYSRIFALFNGIMYKQNGIKYPYVSYDMYAYYTPFIHAPFTPHAGLGNI